MLFNPTQMIGVQTMKIKIFTFCILLLFISLVFTQCSQHSTDPSMPKNGFLLEIAFSENVTPGVMKRGQEAIPKKAPLYTASEYNMARVMVLDISDYDSWADFDSTNEGESYYHTRDHWLQDGGDYRIWSEWRGFLGDFFPIVADQILNIEEDHVTGTVAGVLGNNRIILSLTHNDTIHWLGENDAFGIEGQMDVVEIELGFWY